MLKNFFDREFVWPAILLGAALFISAVAISYTLYAIRGLDNTLSVTGSAKQEVKADRAKWTLEVYRTAFESGLEGAYSKVGSDAAIIKSYFTTQGFAADSITTNTVTADQDWSYNANGGPTRFRVHEEITVESQDVDKIASLAQNVNSILAKGVQVTPRQPEYYISNLPDLRVALLGQAIADAKARATEIAKSGDARVGKIKSAASGVVQVLAPNATNVEDYGSYDTSTIDKEVMVTARATFLVR